MNIRLPNTQHHSYFCQDYNIRGEKVLMQTSIGFFAKETNHKLSNRYLE